MKQEKKEIVVNKIKYTYSVEKINLSEYRKIIKIWNSSKKVIFNEEINERKITPSIMKSKIEFIHAVNNSIEEFKKMSNKDLLEYTINAAGGDDYDGCFTDKGQKDFENLQIELNRRLTEIGFLPNEK